MTGGVECHAIAPHTPEISGQIKVDVGDTITGLTHLGNGWSIGRNVNKGTVGLFPTHCVSIQLTPSKNKPSLSESLGGTLEKIPESGILPSGSLKRNQMSEGLDPGPLPPPPEFMNSDYEDNLTDGTNSQCSTLTRSIKALYANVPPKRPQSDPGKDDPLIPSANVYQCISGSDFESDGFEYDSNCLRRKSGRKKPQIAVKPSRKMNPRTRANTDTMNSVSSQSDIEPPTTRHPHKSASRSCPVDVHVSVQSSDLHSHCESTTNTVVSEPTYSKVTRSMPSVASLGNVNENKDNGACSNQQPGCSYTDIDVPVINSMNKVALPPESEQGATGVDCNWLENQENEKQRKADRNKKPKSRRKYGPQYIFSSLQRRKKRNQDGASAVDGKKTRNNAIPQSGVTESLIPKPLRYQDYRTLQCPSPSHGCGSEPDTSQPQGFIAPGPGDTNYPYGYTIGSETSTDKSEVARSTSPTLVFSILSAFLIGLLVFLWMNYALGYGFLVSIAVSAAISILLCIMFAASRICRCVAALMIPSLATTKGRITFLLIITGFLLGGPVSNIYHNIVEASRSMTCSSEQVYNQSILLVHPFHSLMARLNETSRNLHDAAQNVTMTLVPLNDGLSRMEHGIWTAQRHLRNTKQTCKNFLTTAHHECATGILTAARECTSIMDAFKDIYRKAKTILEQINPDQWQTTPSPMYYQPERMRPSLDALPKHWDLCKKLNHSKLCSDLNRTETLCGSHWRAGKMIQDAINRTRKAMGELKGSLQFNVRSEAFFENQVNTSKAMHEKRKSVLEAFNKHTEAFDTTINVFIKLIPTGIFILIAVSYLYLKHYMAKDNFDNVYITQAFKTLDRKRGDNGHTVLLPLKKYERNQLIDTTTTELSPLEEGLYKIGLCVLILHLLLTTVCYLFDYVMYWILDQINQHGQLNQNVLSAEPRPLMPEQGNLLADLIDTFFTAFHSDGIYNFAVDTKLCLPKPNQPSILYLLVIFFMYAMLIITVLLKAYLLRGRRTVVSYFYEDRENVRMIQLYYKLMNRRSRLFELEIVQAKRKYKEKLVMQQMSIQHKMAETLPPFKLFMYKPCRCYICACPEEQSFIECQTEKCPGVYCSECFKTVGQKCPLCTPMTEYYPEISDAEESVYVSEGYSKFYL